MNIRVKYDHWYPKLINVDGITIYPWILYADVKEQVDPILYKHEMVHVGQIRKEGWLTFYFKYLASFCHNFLRYSYDDAYMAIPYEIEAYAKEDEPLTEAEAAELKPYLIA